MDGRTLDSVMEFFEKNIRERNPIDETTWLQGAASLNVLLGDEYGKLFKLEQRVNQMKADLLKVDEMTSARAKVIVESTDEYRESREQKSKCERVIELIRIAKYLSKAAGDERKGY